MGNLPWSPPPLDPRTHVPVHQHVEADAESLQEGAVLAAVLHLVVLGKPGGRGENGSVCELSCLNSQGSLELDSQYQAADGW